MLFPSASIGDYNFRLLLFRPEINAERGRTIEVSHRFDTTIGEGRTTIEERSAGRAALLLSQRCTLQLRGNGRDDWRKGIAALGGLPVGIPLWIDALPVARWAERIYEPQKVVNFNPTTGAFAIYDADSIPEIPTHPLLAPLLIGRWKERPAAQVRAQSFAEVEVTITEASPWSCRIGIHTQGASFPFLPDRSMPIKDVSDYGLELIELGGAAREPGTDAVNAAARWRQEGEFIFKTRLDIRQALTFFESRAGALESWSPVPAWFQTGADTSGTPDDYTARFASDTLSLTYISGKIARASIGFLQEIDTGERSQAVASEAYLYTLTYQHDDANPELYTNWDEPLIGAEGTFQPAQCVHSEMIVSLRPQDVRAELSVAYVAGTLLADWIVGRLFGKLRVTVEKVDPADIDASRKIIFDGFVRNVLPSGNVLKVTATMFGKMLERKVPSDVFARRCNTYVFSERCDLAEADFDSEGTIEPADISADGMTVTIHDADGWGGPAFPDNHFGPNGIFRTGSGRSTQVATIVSSETVEGNLTVKLSRPVYADLVDGGGQDAQVVPGCGGQRDTDCEAKFDNGDNFRGFDFMATYIDQAGAGAPKMKK